MLVSSSLSTYSYASTLRDKVSDEKLNIADGDWIQYLQDHRELIIAHSTKYELEAEKIHQYQYRLREFLDSVEGSSKYLEQAFITVNKLTRGAYDFTKKLTYVYVPSMTYIQDLRRQYYIEVHNKQRKFKD